MNQPLLSVNNLTHLYAPGKGFSDVSFDLWPGEVLGIVGESGSGKTTLLKSISARLTPQQGLIIIRAISTGAPPMWVGLPDTVICCTARWPAARPR